MTPEELAAIKARAAAATPGPWSERPKIIDARRETECEIVGNIGCGYSTPVCKLYTGFYRYEGDKAFIAAARTDIPVLIAEVRRLQVIEQAAKKFIEARGPAKYHAFNDLGATMGYVYEYRG